VYAQSGANQDRDQGFIRRKIRDVQYIRGVHFNEYNDAAILRKVEGTYAGLKGKLFYHFFKANLKNA
jgi:hypothetical protein